MAILSSSYVMVSCPVALHFLKSNLTMEMSSWGQHQLREGGHRLCHRYRRAFIKIFQYLRSA